MVEELPDAAEEALDMQTVEEPQLPNRPLEENEELARVGPARIVNRAPRQHLVRLYDRNGQPRTFLRELVPLALSQGDPLTGERFYFAKPPKEAQPPRFRCPAPGCQKQLASRRDVRVHVEGFHQAYFQEQQLRRKQREERTRSRQEQALLGLLATLVRKTASEEQAEISPPDQGMTRAELLSWLKTATGKFQPEWRHLSRGELMTMAEAYWAALQQPEAEPPDEDENDDLFLEDSDESHEPLEL